MCLEMRRRSVQPPTWWFMSWLRLHFLQRSSSSGLAALGFCEIIRLSQVVTGIFSWPPSAVNFSTEYCSEAVTMGTYSVTQHRERSWTNTLCTSTTLTKGTERIKEKAKVQIQCCVLCTPGKKPPGITRGHFLKAGNTSEFKSLPYQGLKNLKSSLFQFKSCGVLLIFKPISISQG